MSQVLNRETQTGSKKINEPRLIGEILREYFSTSNEPLYKNYRKFLAEKENNAEKGGKDYE